MTALVPPRSSSRRPRNQACTVVYSIHLRTVELVSVGVGKEHAVGTDKFMQKAYTRD